MVIDDPPSEIWEPTEERFDMKNFEYRNINLYRLAVTLSLKHCRPDFLGKDSKILNNDSQDLNHPSMNEKKMMIRRKRREFYQDQSKRFGWRNNYKSHYYYTDIDPNKPSHCWKWVLSFSFHSIKN